MPNGNGDFEELKKKLQERWLGKATDEKFETIKKGISQKWLGAVFPEVPTAKAPVAVAEKVIPPSIETTLPEIPKIRPEFAKYLSKIPPTKTGVPEVLQRISDLFSPLEFAGKAWATALTAPFRPVPKDRMPAFVPPTEEEKARGIFMYKPTDRWFQEYEQWEAPTIHTGLNYPEVLGGGEITIGVKGAAELSMPLYWMPIAGRTPAIAKFWDKAAKLEAKQTIGKPLKASETKLLEQAKALEVEISQGISAKVASGELAKEAVKVTPKVPEKPPAIPKAEPEVIEGIPPTKLPEAVKPPIKPTVEARLPVPPNLNPVAQHISFSGDKLPSPKLGIGGFFKKLFTKAFDEQYPIRDFVKQAQKLGIQVNIEEDPYVLLNLMKGFYGKANSFLTRGTSGRVFWQVKAGKTLKGEWGKPFQEIVQPIAKKDLDREFSTYLIAKAAIGRKLEERGIKVPFKITEARKVMRDLSGKYPEFKQSADELYKYQDSLLKYAQESGLLSKETIALFRELNKNYVPYYRVLENQMTQGAMGKNVARTKAIFKRIKGSEKPIVDPLESIVRNTFAILHASDANYALNMMVNLAKKHPALSEMVAKVKVPIRPVAQVTPKELGLEGLTQAQVETVATIFRPSFFSTENNVASILINGKRAFYKIEPDLYKALASMNQGDIGILMRALSYPAKMLRAGAVLSPDFSLARNPARDTLSAFVYSRFGFIPVYDTLQGIAAWAGKKEAYQLMERAGILKSMLVSIDRQYTGKTLQEILRGKPSVQYIKHPLETLQILSELTEMGSRMGEAKLALAKGKTPIQAAFAGRDVTLDFGIMGVETRQRALNNIIAFFNANMRATEKLARETIQHPKTVLPKAIVGITIPSVLLYLNNRNDPRWQEIPQWQKDLFWIIFTEKNIYRIPKPFELGLVFGSIPERMLEYMDSQDPEMFKELWRNIVEVGTPGFIPTAALPIIENMTNYNFFLDQEIVPRGREQMPAELQYRLYTPEIVKKFGEWVNYAPAKIDNILQGYTASLGRYAIQVLDRILKGTGILPDIPEPSPTLADRPVIRALLVRDPYGSAGETINKFYDALEKAEANEGALKEWLRLNNEKKYTKYLNENPEVMFTFDWATGDTYSASARYLRRISSDLSEIRRKQYEIFQDPDMSSEDKRIKIDEINFLMTQMAHLALGNLKEMPDELRLDLIPETAIEPTPAKALLQEVADIVPKYLREHMKVNEKEWLGKDLKAIRSQIRDMKEADQSLLDKYDKETKDKNDTFRQLYRKNNPDIDAALRFWDRVSILRSREALTLLKQRADKLGLPYTIWTKR